MKNKGNIKIIIAGEGGQGVQVLAHAFAISAFNSDLKIAYMPNYGVEQRGGVSLGYLQFGKEEIGFPKFETADILVLMCERAIDRVRQYLGNNTLCIYDSAQIAGDKLADFPAEKLAIPATEVATKKLIPKVSNMVLAGALVAEIEMLSRKTLESTLEEIFSDKYKKRPELRNFNKKALALGEKLAKEGYAKN